MAAKSKASRAESKVTEAKKKNASAGTSTKAKNKGAEKNAQKEVRKESGGAGIPSSTVTALISLALFVLFLVIQIQYVHMFPFFYEVYFPL